MAEIENTGGIKEAVNDHASKAKDESELFETMAKSPHQDLDQTAPTIEISMSTVSGGSPMDSHNSSKSDVWVSPNKSGEADANDSFENLTTLSEHTVHRDNKSPSEKDNDVMSPFEYSSVKDTACDASFADDRSAKASSDLMVVGSRIETLALDDNDTTFDLKDAVPPLDLSVISDPELQINASCKNWIKIHHDGKEKIFMLPAQWLNKSFELGIFEITETLAASFNITDDVDIVALTTAAILSEDQKLKHHGEVVIPLSLLASGQLKAIMEAGNDSVPTFGLVTKKLCHLDSRRKGTDGVFANDFDDTAMGRISFGEEEEFTDAFIDLMKNSDAFTEVEKNALMKFGIDESLRGNILYRAAFRLAVFTSNSNKFVMGLKAIANVLLGNENSDQKGAGSKRSSSISMESLTQFISAADELFEGGDLITERYITVIDAIYFGHQDVENLFDLYGSPDFIIACGDSEPENVRGALLIRDIMSLSNVLPPISTRPSDEMLKWAIHTGIHNFGISLSSEDQLPVEFRNILYHMFSSGDEIVLSACANFVETNDSKVMDEMLHREWGIYCRNREQFFVPHEEAPPVKSMSDEAMVPAEVSHKDVPDLLLTAVSALVDLGKIPEDTATMMIASVMKGNAVLEEIYEDYVEHGDTKVFFDELRAVASDEQFSSTRALASSNTVNQSFPPVTDTISVYSKGEVEDTFKEALGIISSDHKFGALEISALRLAAVRKDVFLSNALSYYIKKKDYNTFVRDLLYVAHKIIHETEVSIERS